MISVKFTLTSGQVMEFRNVQSTIEDLGLKCGENQNILVRGVNGKMMVLVGRHIESIQEL